MICRSEHGWIGQVHIRRWLWDECFVSCSPDGWGVSASVWLGHNGEKAHLAAAHAGSTLIIFSPTNSSREM